MCLLRMPVCVLVRFFFQARSTVTGCNKDMLLPSLSVSACIVKPNIDP